MGQKKNPFYRIIVADSRSPRDGRFIEEIGTGTWYTATANWNQSGNLSNYTSGSVSIYSRYPSYNNGTGNYNNAASGTLVNGAQPTEVVGKLLKIAGIEK